LKKILQFKAMKVLTSDPYVAIDSQLVPEEILLKQADIIIIGAPHLRYQNLETDKPIIDIWNIRNAGNLI